MSLRKTPSDARNGAQRGRSGPGSPLGGRLRLVAEFPDRPAIRLKGFGEPDFEDSLEDGDIPATPEPSAASNT